MTQVPYPKLKTRKVHYRCLADDEAIATIPLGPSSAADGQPSTETIIGMGMDHLADQNPLRDLG